MLKGNNAANILRAGAGKDVIIGGLGADIIDGGADTDMVDYSADAGTHGVIVNLSSSTITLGNLDALDFGYTLGDLDVASNTAYDVGNNDTLIFDALISIEYVTGTGFKDVLIGSDFNNRLVGGGGSDTLTGGAGGDGFQYNFASEGGDTITDFDPTLDFIRIDQSNFGIAENEDAGQHPEAAAGIEQLAANYFVLGNTATEGGHGQFIYDGSTGELFWDDDGTGGNAQVLLATLQDTPSLTIDDILLI
jgi:Ca2+-binding RTX toxin-like protein